MQVNEHTINFTLPKTEFLLTAKLCLNSTYFEYNAEYTKLQIFGTAMSSPLSALIANLVMKDLEQDLLNKLCSIY